MLHDEFALLLGYLTARKRPSTKDGDMPIVSLGVLHERGDFRRRPDIYVECVGVVLEPVGELQRVRTDLLQHDDQITF